MKEFKEQPAFPVEIRINKLACDGCGACATICPNSVLVLKDISDEEIAALSFMGRLYVRLKGKTKSYVSDPDSCIACRRCEKICHERAIRVGRKD
ncbi:MAG: 4Fe-4S dicluster domain-containing protein [Tannerella sp.]|jgi:ferredoxin|nr:4Fe-4S dicluster domain-containing protein [Tannerella sp.]